MEQFVCVRLVQANRLDLTQFQFDFDLTFCVFFMNADGTIYGRYGTRSNRDEADRELTTDGFAKSMNGALTLHQRYPENKRFLAGKQAKPTKYKTPDDFPSLKGKYQATINYNSGTSKSCLHCHQISDAERAIYRDAGNPIPDQLVYAYPLPETIGLSFDPSSRATVKNVVEGSPADAAGFKIGDELLTLDSQAILSIADVQWLLHHAGASGNLDALVQRGDKFEKLSVGLNEGWRRAADISWRVSTWPLRRMGLGGMVLKSLSPDELSDAQLDDSKLALLVDRVGQYGPHAAAKRAGFRQGDVIVSFNGVAEPMTESDLLTYTVQNTKPGQQVEVIVIRGGQRITMKLPMQP